ncbi:hypothetical protein [Phocaeicola sp.]|uniref:hypothetical protein n=1 Tax=Phocaeicola sp. TaxID=2773926 RepID=UPI003AB674E4
MRLCTNDVLTREKLIAYHDSYAKVIENTVCNEAYVTRKYGIRQQTNTTLNTADGGS